MTDEILRLQQDVCKKYGVIPHPSPMDHKVGISLTVKQGLIPINGMRIRNSEDSTGWFFWAGEHLSDDPNFFVPLHVSHLTNWCMDVIPFLLLPPGWRFLTDGDYFDVWYDPQLLKPEE